MYNLIGSFECSGYGTYQHCQISPEDIWTNEGIDHALLDNEYDAAIISFCHQFPSREVTKQLGYKIALCWWDSILSMDRIKSWSPIVHQLCFDQGQKAVFPNCFSVETPQDTRYFYKDNTMEDIDVSFTGSMSVSDWPDRQILVEKIRNANINIWTGGGRNEGNLSIKEYSDIFRHSKICLNFSYGQHKPQKKGRAFEIASCGQFMLTNCPEMYAGWFEDGVDFISFTSEDIIDKIHYYLAHRDKREAIANNMYKKSIRYSPKYFWWKIIAICNQTHLLL